MTQKLIPLGLSGPRHKVEIIEKFFATHTIEEIEQLSRKERSNGVQQRQLANRYQFKTPF